MLKNYIKMYVCVIIMYNIYTSLDYQMNSYNTEINYEEQRDSINLKSS